jgi:AraC-like DNA-binding protein
MLVLNHFADSVETRAIMNRGHDRLERLMPLFEHIDSHSGEPIRVGDAARISAMTVPYFMHFFRKSTGRTFIGYLNSFRVARAQSLLSSTDKSIVDISYETGFCNQSYFGVIFRRVAGMTPLDYRRRSRGSQNPPPAAARLGDSELSQSLPMLLPSVCHLEVSYLDQPPAGQIGPHGTARLWAVWLQNRKFINAGQIGQLTCIVWFEQPWIWIPSWIAQRFCLPSTLKLRDCNLQVLSWRVGGSKAPGGGIHEGQECDSSGAAVRRTATELCWAALLGTPQSGRRRQTVGADEPVAITCPYGGPNQTGTVFAAQHQSFRAVLHLLTNH